MASYLGQQLLSMVVTLFIAGIFVFSLVRLVPGDPVIAAIGVDDYTPALYEATARRLGLDLPLHQQFLDYVRRLLTLDLGNSFRGNRPVLQNIAEQLPHSIDVTVLSLAISVLIGLPAGVLAAVRRNSWIDRGTMITALLALCAPNFLLGLLLIIFFSGYLQWFPTFGVGSRDSLVSIVQHAFLPALALGASAAGVQARMVRSSLIETLSQDYVRTAKAKGLGPRLVLFKHALRNALSPVVTLIGIDLSRLLTGTVIIETMFARRGVGKMLIDAIHFRDYPQIQGTLLVFIGIVILANTLTDIVYSMLDPRVRYA